MSLFIRTSTYLIKLPKRYSKLDITPPRGMIHKPQPILEGIKNIPKYISKESKIMKKYLTKKIYGSSVRSHMSYEYLWNFRDMPEDELEDFKVISDSNNGGYSEASLTKHPMRNTGLFNGYLDTKVPKSGEAVRSGLACIMGPTNFFLGRDYSYNFEKYNCFVIKYRGDGRTYMLNVHMNFEFDLLGQDLYCHPLFTQGGSHWQTAKIPFHQFVLSAMGRLQDKQYLFYQQKVRTMSISLMDGCSGEFELEIDSLSVLYDAHMNEEYSYELYVPEFKYQRFH